MTGLDYTRADLDTRSRFAVTKEQSQRLITALVANQPIAGAVLISTCNRTELYVSIPDDAPTDLSPTALLCEMVEQDYTACQGYFVERENDLAISHLSRVAAGLDSQILGDDQIITQTREALELARELGTADSYLETFFRQAISAAKAIKTNVIMKALGAASVPLETIKTLKTLTAFAGKKAVVIGNGVIGRSVAELLINEGVSVTVTLRQYHRGAVQVPAGAATIGYIDRYQAIDGADIVVSATTSNHYTLRTDELTNLISKPHIIIDLAVPRDVEPTIDDLGEVRLLTVDDIAAESQQLSAESLATVAAIIDEHANKYLAWKKNKEALAGLELSQPTDVSDSTPGNVTRVTPPEKGRQMRISAVGLGPGNPEYMAPRARQAILESDCVVGYISYLRLIPDLLTGKQTIATGMRSETKRCQAAIDEALKGQQVCVVCSGDAGVYGMAGLLFELAEGHPELEIEVVPGITAATAAAAVLGSPLTNDFAVISLSDLLTPWDVIAKRLEAAAAADLVLCLYNPQSHKRDDYLRRACDILLRHKPPDTNCGYVRNAFRGEASESQLCTLDRLAGEPVDMLTTVIVGNSDTRVTSGKLVTARGYRL
ncbi:MAG: precorrin-3B C(17)-methyltransferase [Coriobacteriales bacterium]|jgi:glutamyl-tRNA reductase|nr:precorrin-3B C(17)-methyltransferase [Coriobacteriales bacterium]